MKRKSKFRSGYADWQLGTAFLDKTIRIVEHDDGSVDAYDGDKFLETFTKKAYYNIAVVRGKTAVAKDRGLI